MKPSPKSPSDTPTRRAVIVAGLGAPVAAATLAVRGAEAEAPTVDAHGSPLIQDTPHTRAHLDSARF